MGAPISLAELSTSCLDFSLETLPVSPGASTSPAPSRPPGRARNTRAALGSCLSLVTGFSTLVPSPRAAHSPPKALAISKEEEDI